MPRGVALPWWLLKFVVVVGRLILGDIVVFAWWWRRQWPHVTVDDGLLQVLKRLEAGRKGISFLKLQCQF